MAKTADAPARHWTDRLPAWAGGYARLARWDRPVGWRLLLAPCLMGLALARGDGSFVLDDLRLAALFLVGAIAMRGAGCTYNDIIDRGIDARVARTRARPIPSGAVSVRAAAAWLCAQCLVGLGVLLALPTMAQLVALLSLPLVAAYPLMKRITWWPQAWLGLAFSWGALVAGAAIEGAVTLPIALLYLGCIAWTIAYDTIYALQDLEDDALVGVQSTARLFDKRWKPAVLAFLSLAALLWFAAASAAIGAFTLGPLLFGGWLLFAAMRLDRVRRDHPKTALAGFRDHAGLGFFAAMIFALEPLSGLVGRLLGS